MKKKTFYILLFLLSLSVLLSIINIINQDTPETTADPATKRFGFSAGGKGIYCLEITGPIVYQTRNSALMPTTTGVKYWTAVIDRIRKKNNIKGLLLRINSPGGTMGASQELLNAVRRFKQAGKPVVVSVIDICASGAYYISIPADAIIANSGSMVGSIGVIISSLEFSELLEKWGIEQNVIKSGRYKDIFSPTRDMTISEKRMLQQTVDEMHTIFLKDVIAARQDRSSAKEIKAVADGRILSASAAQKAGLIDQTGDSVTAKKKLAELCGLDYETLKVITPARNKWQQFIENINVAAPWEKIRNLFTRQLTIPE
ncbi:MAG TPA: signal peptide peptidase SppA [Spirochaetota bacterium]|nr:signal peptide peptidase SppA [Spirochaetota bacterium]